MSDTFAWYDCALSVANSGGIENIVRPLGNWVAQDVETFCVEDHLRSENGQLKEDQLIVDETVYIVL